MLVTTSAPIVEETSSANGRRRKRTGKFGQRAGEKFKSGYSRLKEAGGLPVIENLLGLGQGATNSRETNFMPPPIPDANATKQGMSTTTKVVIGVLVAGVVAGAIYYFVKVKGKKSK